ncbi:hypothetical protein WSTR_04585 [Wolbachia endosymbiont of Laodelphax striatellus]|uniref:ankyrin repeat domain-containing protein n=1 Tax=Wolbachia endosymbiont of Laodelphax striatellus TaxID=368602 RepID=UPI0007C4BBFE|nr:ankyrin repeat domain-containing protein [Wolbachia endosymbiont of Laodelphax striatellus]OAB81281.1 hypothetical protein WSTR_04585 [Wolbachia endosymbiont of Laodelphax striatellus]
MLGKENTKEQVADDQSESIREQKKDTLPSSSQQTLRLPEGFTVGKAVDMGDCFFHAVAQGLKHLKPDMSFTVKSLREVCRKRALDKPEIKEKIITDAKRCVDDKSKPSPKVSDDELWKAYLFRVVYTAQDMEKIKSKDSGLYEKLTDSKYGKTLNVPVWGRPEIEGRMICSEYDVNLHVIENLPVCGWSDQLVDGLASRSIGYVDFSEENTIHIINKTGIHFEPILRGTEQQISSHYYDTIASEKKLDSESVYLQQNSGVEMKDVIDNQMDCEYYKEPSHGVEVLPADSIDDEDRLSDEDLQYKQSQESSISSRVADSSSIRIGTANGVDLDYEIVKRVTYFVETFVKEFKEEVHKRSKEAKPDSKIEKRGKTLDYLDLAQKSFISPSSTRLVTDKISEILSLCSAQQHKIEVKRFIAKIAPFRENIREVLVEASLEIFQKFGDQFMRVVDVGQPSWERGIEKLAMDATSRAIHYISNIDKKEDLPVNLITKGIILGQSKSPTIIRDILQNYGHKVQDEKSGETWSTSDLFRNIGIKKASGNHIQYFTMKKNNCAEKYGYRFPLKWESEGWSNIYEYQQNTILRKEEYKSIFNEREKEELFGNILRGMNGKDPLEQDENISQYSFNFSSEENFFYVEREGMYEELASHLYGQSKEEKTSRMLVINGDPGVGKSTLARRYGLYERFRHVDVWIIWIDASSNTNISENFRQIAKELKIPTLGQEIKSIVKNIYKFVLDKKILFIFDDASSYKQIVQFLPSYFPEVFSNRERPFIIITSCNKNWTVKTEEEQKGKKGKIIQISKIELDALQKAEIYQSTLKSLRKRLSNINIQETKDLAEALNCIPSAMKQALAYIKNLNASTKMQGKTVISKYLKCFNKMMQESTDYLVVPNVNKELSIALEINLNEIKKKDIGQKAYDILSFMAYLNPNQIDVEKFFLWGKSEKNKQRVLSALDLLCKFSIIEFKGPIGKIDKEIQAVIRSKHKQKGTEEKFLEKIILLLECNYITDVGHIVSVWNYISKYNKLVNKFINSNYIGYNILHLLVIYGNKEVINLILEKIDSSQLSNIINVNDKYKNTPLEYAAMYGHLKLVEYFIEKEEGLKGDYTILYWAAACAQLEIIKYLFTNNKNYDINKTNKEGDTALDCAIKNSEIDNARYFDVVKYLVKQGADINKQNENDDTPLHLAAENDSLNIVKYLVEQGADIDKRNEDDDTPLHLAAGNDSLNIVEYLVEQGADINKQNEDGNTPLHLAIKNNHLDSVICLVSKGADVNLQNKKGMSVLHLAAQKGHLNSVMYSVMQGADVNLQDNGGNTPLHLAAKLGHSHIAYYLMRYGANVNLQNKKGMSPVDYDVMNNHSESAYYLYNFGATINPRYRNLVYCPADVNNYSYNLEPQLNFPHLGIQLHKNQQETSACLSVSKKIKLENVSRTSEENASNTQLIQGTQNTLPFNTKESLFKLKRKLDYCNKAMQEEEINSQLENSYSQQLVNNIQM